MQVKSHETSSNVLQTSNRDDVKKFKTNELNDRWPFYSKSIPLFFMTQLHCQHELTFILKLIKTKQKPRENTQARQKLRKAKERAKEN